MSRHLICQIYKMMVSIQFLIPILLLFVAYVYRCLKKRYQYWENRGVPQSKTNSLFFGDDYEYITGKFGVAEMTAKHYNNLAPHKYGGIYNFFKPILFIRDPELIKQMLITDYHHFYDRNANFSNKDDPISRHLSNLTGEEWKMVRSKLSPTFTAGKMKMLLELINECVEKLNEIIEKSCKEGGALEVNDLMARFATDVIGSCAFGLDVDSLHDTNSIFLTMGKVRFSPSWRSIVRQALQVLCPKLISLLNYQEVPQYVSDFYTNILKDMIQQRKQTGVVRNDFLNLLMTIHTEAEDKEQFDLNTGFLPAQCFVFLVAGFESTSTTMSLVLYELAKHPDVQEKLRAEVDDILEKHHGRINYDSLQEMRYMDKVINETLRLFPPSPRLLRVCTAEYRIPDSNYVMEKGQQLMIATGPLMKDPQYFPDPEVFNPENFSEEAKLSRPACSFLPFGTGHRNCIAMRFAMMEIKSVLARIIKEYKMSFSPEMKFPIKFTPFIILSTLDCKILLQFNKRQIQNKDD